MRLYKLTSQMVVITAAVGCGSAPGRMDEVVTSAVPAAQTPEPAADSGQPERSVPASAGGRAAAVSSKGGAGSVETSAGSGGGAGRPPAANSGGDYTFLQCANATPPPERDKNDDPACDGEIQCGGAAHCIPLARLEMRLSETLIARTPDCSGGKCVPDAITLAGSVQFKACTGDLGEGRCIPRCFALAVEPLSAIFERGAFGCGSEEVCAPCTHPATGQPSSACQSDTCGTAN